MILIFEYIIFDFDSRFVWIISFIFHCSVHSCSIRDVNPILYSLLEGVNLKYRVNLCFGQYMFDEQHTRMSWDSFIV